jgi:5-methylcytosine-specific restriction enzyme subunit McrC
MKLDSHFLTGKPFWEHHDYYDKGFIISEVEYPDFQPAIFFKGKTDCICFAINQNRTINNSYYIGTDWLIENEKAVYVQSKINKESDQQINYLEMFFQALKHPAVFDQTKDLFEIKWNKPEIKINQQQDILTPLLIVQYLQVVKSIVRKGLKKSYYKVERNLYSRVKGKILISKNIKQNLVKGKTLNTYCSYDEFGFDGIENRILKKALVFIQRYLLAHKNLGSEFFFAETFNYITPAFSQVSEEASIRDCQNLKVNPLYKEYKLAIELAKQILKRFGYNISNTSTTNVSTPPFWIDMSKLFELYVLGLLKDKYPAANEIDYHFTTSGNELDFVINTPTYKMVVDAKYKLKYQDGLKHEDMRQVSGYARLKKVHVELEKDENEMIDCLIIYPEGFLNQHEKESIDLEKKKEIEEYVSIYKYGVKLPVIKQLAE